MAGGGYQQTEGSFVCDVFKCVMESQRLTVLLDLLLWKFWF